MKCVNCKNVIPKERRKILPDTVHCVQCSKVQKISGEVLELEKLDDCTSFVDPSVSLHKGKLPSEEGDRWDQL